MGARTGIFQEAEGVNSLHPVGESLNLPRCCEANVSNPQLLFNLVSIALLLKSVLLTDVHVPVSANISGLSQLNLQC